MAITVSDSGTVRRMIGCGGMGASKNRKSNGTNNSYNVSHRIWSPIPIVNPELSAQGFCYDSGTESDLDNTLTLHGAIKGSDGVLHDCGTITVNPGDIDVRTVKLIGVTIPAGFIDIIAHGRVPNGGFYYANEYFRNAARFMLMEEGVDLPDKTLAGAIGPGAANLPAAFVGIVGDAPIRHRLIGINGDSISVGLGRYIHPRISTAIGICAGYIVDKGTASYLHTGFAGAAAAQNKSNYAKRLAYMASVGVTDIYCDLGVNDLNNPALSDITLTVDLATFHDKTRTAVPGVRIWQSTITPSTKVTGPRASDTNQVVVAAMQDGRRGRFNTSLRSGGLGSHIDGFIEHAIPAQSTTNSDWWGVGYSNDGLHPLQAGGNAIVTAVSAANPMGL
ncbi:SGNH/GDSL hydrolase family protein [Neorhizobium sp. P12A]|uniref:SGNH/GDSL hydrolase family protein n=1 Tax=Neorhizobium sp. P12A TaxID=2268027 RepID=UPI0011ED1FA5|nr:SGNH/GDSL hydrolase family protein [Neorhizobium sp. P12A]